MARVVKLAEERQNEILDVAQGLFMLRGYDATSIQAIIDAVGIAKGTFYHHFPSKPALLDALVARMRDQAVALMRPLVEDPAVGAVDKLNGMFSRMSAWKAERRELMLDLHRALNSEANATMLGRIQRDQIEALTPLVARIVEQGVGEGAFDTPFPFEAARLVLELGTATSRRLGEALLAAAPPALAEIERDFDAFQHAVERILGAPPGSVHLVDREVIAYWFGRSG